MKQINNYIIEKLKINKDIKIKKEPEDKEGFLNDFLKNHRISAWNERNIPLSLSNYTFSFSEYKRREKYSDLVDNIGYEDAGKVFKYEIALHFDEGAQGICDAINSSDLGYTNWEVVKDSLPYLFMHKEKSGWKEYLEIREIN